MEHVLLSDGQTVKAFRTEADRQSMSDDPLTEEELLCADIKLAKDQAEMLAVALRKCLQDLKTVPMSWGCSYTSIKPAEMALERCERWGVVK